MCEKRAPWRHERKELVSEIHGAAADTLTNNVIVKTFAAEDREIKHLNKLTDRFRKIFVRFFCQLVMSGFSLLLCSILSFSRKI